MQIKMQKSSDFFHIFKKIFLILRKTQSKFGVPFQIIYREKRLGIKPPFWEKKLFQSKLCYKIYFSLKTIHSEDVDVTKNVYDLIPMKVTRKYFKT